MYRLLKLPRRLALLLATAIASGVFLIDIISIAELRTFPLYFAGIILAASVGTRLQTYVFAGFCTLLWIASKHMDGTIYTSSFTWFWNSLMQGFAFFLVAILVQRLTHTVSEAHRYSAELADRNRRLYEQQDQLTHMNVELGDALRAVEDADRIARHDLRTPLGGIIATVGLLISRPDLDPEERRLLSIARRAARRALAMVNLTLSLRRMERGEFQLDAEPVDLHAAVLAVMDDLREHADAKSLRIANQVADGLPAAEGQSDLVYSLVANLVRNAIEAAPEGSTVHLELSAQETSVALRVANAGAVPAEIRERFFTKYATSGKPGGSGLGAYSARLIARALGGELVMTTSDHFGTTLDLSLRRATTEVPVAPLPHVRIGHPLSFGTCPAILIVDDDEYNRLLLSRMLPPDCKQVRNAVNGKLALEQVREQRPDLIFMDINMPLMGGVEALHAIRLFQREARQAPSVIVAFSAIDDAASQDGYLAEGFDACLGKPCTRQDVMALLSGKNAAAAAEPDNDTGTVWIDADLLPMLDEFRRSRTTLLEALVDALDQGDRAQSRRLSHQLGGSLGIFGFHAASNDCKKIEADVDAGDTATLATRARAVLAHFKTATVRPR